MTNTQQKTLKFSINPELINKIPPSDKRALADGFISVEWSIDDLAMAISEEGWAFSYQFKDGHRKAVNFIATDILAVDIDDGMDVAEALQHPIFKTHGALLYTTPSHIVEEPRFRLVFITPRTITDANEASWASKALARRLGGDNAATDKARMFYGSRGCQIETFDQQMSFEMLDELITDGREQASIATIRKPHHVMSSSTRYFKADLEVMTAKGMMVNASELTSKTSIYCPFHKDRNPSAFFDIKEGGDGRITCMKCEKTWWSSNSNRSSLAFNSFEDIVKNIKTGKNIENKVPAQNIFDTKYLKEDRIFLSDSKFIELSELNDGMSFIKSQKATGKTTFLSKFVSQMIHRHQTLEEYEEAYGGEGGPNYTNEKVLLIGHRRSLIGSLCKSLDLNCYLDDSSGEMRRRRNRYGICLDSLERIRGHKYDLIVIDEVEQLLAHFMSKTLGNKRESIFALFAELLCSAKKIVVLDADLGATSFITLTAILNQAEDWKDTQGRVHNEVPVHIYINNYIKAGQKLNLYENQSHMVKKLISDVTDGKRVFVTSNSRTKIETLTKALKESANVDNRKLEMISVTGDNSSQEGIQEFIKNIKTEILNYQVVLCSPSLGTGIDITFDNEEKKIDCVYGFFEGLINSHFDIDQQLSRVRHPKEINVWISPQTHRFETDFDFLKDERIQERLVPNLHDGSDRHSKTRATYHLMAALLLTHHRASINQLKTNFIEYKIANGFEINHIGKNEKSSKEGAAIYKDAKMLITEESIKNILTAPVLSQDQYHDFDENSELKSKNSNKQDLHSFDRTKIEIYFGTTITRELISLYGNGRFRDKFDLYEGLVGKITAKVKQQDHDGFVESLDKNLFKNKRHSVDVLHKLLSATPFFKNGVIDPDVTYSKEDLAEFVVQAISLKPEAETQLNLAFRWDIREEPVRYLNSLLKLIGLSTTKTHTVQDRVKTYHYSVNSADLLFMDSLVKKRSPFGNFVSYNKKTFGPSSCVK